MAQRNILQRVGTPSALSKNSARPISSSNNSASGSSNSGGGSGREGVSVVRKALARSSSPVEDHHNMNVKQEGPFLVPPLWKDSISLENIANDFLESNVTGEVMNLDDFLKELQVTELVQQDEIRFPQSNPVSMSQEMPGRYNLIRPTNIETLKEPQHPTRPPIMHHVGKPPELYQFQMQNEHQHQQQNQHQSVSHSQQPHVSQHQQQQQQQQPQQQQQQHGHHHDMLGGGGVGPDVKDVISPSQSIPQASVRPLIRPLPPSQQGHLHHPVTKEEKEPLPKRLRTTSEDSDDSHFEGGFTSTVCVKFSPDDLRLATIPGQGQDFDPATRRFSEEELKPQPIIRKRKKQFVPEELKNNKYWAKRTKNNEAAKRSREARRLKENQIAMRARYLEEENVALKAEVDTLKKENLDLKQMMMNLEEKLNQMAENR